MARKLSLWVVVFVVFHYAFSRFRRLFFGLAKRHEEDIFGRTVIITGANSGLGKRTAFEMARRGATVVLACRNLVLGKRAADEIKLQTGSKNLILMELDLADLDSVRKFSKAVEIQFPKIDILVNCAGIYDTSGQIEYTKAGFETHFGVNYLGHFLLTNLLLNNLKAGAPSRIVTVSSFAAVAEEMDLEDLNFKKHKGVSSYGPFFGTFFGRAYGIQGMVDTEIFRNQGFLLRLFTYTSLLVLGLTLAQGVETILYCALSKLCAHETAQCYQFSRIYKFGKSRNSRELSKKLWEKSEEFVGFYSENNNL